MIDKLSTTPVNESCPDRSSSIHPDPLMDPTQPRGFSFMLS